LPDFFAAVLFLEVVFVVAAFFAVLFLAVVFSDAVFFEAAFWAGGFFAAVFLVVAFLAVAFLVEVFWEVPFFAAAFPLDMVFFVVFFLATGFVSLFLTFVLDVSCFVAFAVRRAFLAGLAGVSTSAEAVSPISISTPKTDDSSSDSRARPLWGLPPVDG